MIYTFSECLSPHLKGTTYMVFLTTGGLGASLECQACSFFLSVPPDKISSEGVVQETVYCFNCGHAHDSVVLEDWKKHAKEELARRSNRREDKNTKSQEGEQESDSD